MARYVRMEGLRSWYVDRRFSHVCLDDGIAWLSGFLSWDIVCSSGVNSPVASLFVAVYVIRKKYVTRASIDGFRSRSLSVVGHCVAR